MMSFSETEILVRSRLTLGNVGLGAAIVSISDDPDDYPDLPDGCLTSMRLHFHDVEVDIPGCKAFTEAQATDVATFVKEALERSRVNCLERPSTRLVFQCEVGISRSAAMAAAVARWIRNDDMPYFRDYLPNRLVYRLTLEALRG